MYDGAYGALARKETQQIVGREGTLERCPSVPQSNVPKLQARVVQMPSILSIRTNHEGDSLPRKRRGGFACAMACSDVGREVLRFLVQRNNKKQTRLGRSVNRYPVGLP